MRSFFLLALIFCLQLQTASAETKIYYNKNIKNSKQFSADIIIANPKSVYNDLNILEAQGISMSDISLFNYYQEVTFENGTLIIAWKFNTEYVSDSFFKGMREYLSEMRPSIRLFWKNSNEKYQKAIDKKYFKVGSKTETTTIQYLKMEKQDIFDNAEGIKEKVVMSEIIQFQGKTILVTLDCLVLPFKTLEKVNWSKATSSDQLIELFGLPDKIETYSFQWPDKKSKNGLYYSPEINQPVSGEHWRFAKYPDLVIDISEGKKIRQFVTDRDLTYYNQVITSN